MSAADRQDPSDASKTTVRPAKTGGFAAEDQPAAASSAQQSGNAAHSGSADSAGQAGECAHSPAASTAGVENDPIAAAFANMREQARRRNGRLPDMSRSVSRAPRKTSDVPTRSLGRPTGPDGRALRDPRTPSALGGLIDREIKGRGWSTSIASGWVHGNWDEVVGEKIAQHTRVEMFKEGTLFITCDSTAWATNLRVMQRTILQTIAEKVGPNVVKQLRIFGPKAPSWRKGPLHVPGRGPRDTYG